MIKAFHDCVGSTGCDGCLNTDQASNAGLNNIVNALARDRRDNYPVRKTISYHILQYKMEIVEIRTYNSYNMLYRAYQMPTFGKSRG